MKTNCTAQAEEYYKLVAQKDIEGVKKHLHPDVEFYGPLATLKGKDIVAQTTANFMNAFDSLTIRAVLGAENQGMVVYNVDLPGVAKDFRGASWLTFRDGLIIKIELFYDASHLSEKKEEIFHKAD